MSYVLTNLCVLQEKQRQQDQQLQRHLTRPPPQYQDQSGQPANQNPFPTPQLNQFTGETSAEHVSHQPMGRRDSPVLTRLSTASSQPMGSSMGGPPPGTQRLFPQNPGVMGLGPGGGPPSNVAPPPAAGQADISLPSCGGGGAGVDVQQVLYNNMNLHPAHAGHPPPQAAMQHQPLGALSAPYRQSLLAQQHLKPPPSTAMLKQQMTVSARVPGNMQSAMATNLPGAMQGTQSAAWQQPAANAFSSPPNAFHMQQPRIPKMAPGAAAFNSSSRQMGGMNSAQQMMQTNMAAAQQRPPPGTQTLGQPLANQQQTQQQPGQNQAVLPELAAFGQPPGNGRQALPCNQGYQVSRTASQQQQVSFGYNVASGSFAAESELVDSLLKGQSTQEWMADLDELLASHH